MRKNISSKFFSSNKPLGPGLYHYISPQEDPRNYRLHLRIEVDGSGILIINGSTILHLNQTATEFAYYLVNNFSPKKVSTQMSKRYHVSQQKAFEDYSEFINRVQSIIETPDLDPVTFLGFEQITALSGAISAPYRLDCALTYHLPQNEDPSFAPIDRVKSELTTDQWCEIFDKAWKIGIPHIVFTGGEPTLREDLMDLIKRVETNGQISGIISDGQKLENIDYLNELLNAGLDHLMILFDPDTKNSWNILQNITPADIFTAIHLTYNNGNLSELLSVINHLAKQGVKAISLSTSNPELKNDILQARQRIAECNLQLIWDLPVPYSSHNPVNFEVGNDKVEGAGRAWLYIEPDGDILPTQGVNEVMGNFLLDPWEKIWHKYS